MKGNKLNFKTEKLLVHWLEISIEGFYDLEFNSIFRESDKRVSQSFIRHPKNKFNVIFIRPCLKYWSGTKLIFSGENGTNFYKLVQQNKVNWKILKLGLLTLSWFDVYYLEKINDSDENSVNYFLQD